MTKCAVCRTSFGAGDYAVLAEHLYEEADKSDAAHVRWLNHTVGKRKLPLEALAAELEESYRLPPEGLSTWIRRRFIARFFGARPHPFVVALQHPSPATLLGYAVEHRHFLEAWVRCCAYVMARSPEPEVARYEIDNLRTEFAGDGPDAPAHVELLLRMGESVGKSREEIASIAPTPTTERAVAEWLQICASERWVAAMAAMHTLELIAHRGLIQEGASVAYFDPAILEDGSIPPAAAAFLRAGYAADVGHADRALDLVHRFATEPSVIEEVQSIVLRSIDLFDDYLSARLERAEEYGSTG